MSNESNPTQVQTWAGYLSFCEWSSGMVRLLFGIDFYRMM
ncbi:hypothetical protein ACVLHI_004212 [Paenibacillus sp. PvR053]